MPGNHLMILLPHFFTLHDKYSISIGHESLFEATDFRTENYLVEGRRRVLIFAALRPAYRTSGCGIRLPKPRKFSAISEDIAGDSPMHAKSHHGNSRD